jgi:sortase (surface protein transpeptidase)
MILAAVLAGCGNKDAGKGPVEVTPSLIPTPVVHKTLQPTVQPTLIVPEPFFDPDLDIYAGPVDVPLELQIPSIKVDAPVIGVGLNSKNEMDAPRGPIGSSIWKTAMWYRGSGIPGEPGTAMFAGHVNDPLGLPGVFGHLRDLHTGDPIIVHFKNTSEDISFAVDQVIVLNRKQASDPALLAQIFGSSSDSNDDQQPEPDGLSHLTLVTCTGYIVNGEYDGFRVVFATRSN